MQAEAVAAVVQAHKQITLDELQAVFPNQERSTIQRSLNRAERKGLVLLLRKGTGGYRPVPAVWAHPDEDPRSARLVVAKQRMPPLMLPKVASVWELGSPREDWPQMQPGRVCSPMGAWDALAG